MSLIVTVLTREGVVMASDSRTSYTKATPKVSGVVETMTIPQSDSTHKTFACQKRFGVSTCGNANINGLSIGALVKEFSDKSYQPSWDLSKFSDALGKYISSLPNCGRVIFHVAGFENNRNITVPGCRRVIVNENGTYLVNGVLGPDVIWDGAVEILNRLTMSGYMVGKGNIIRVPLITIPIKNPDGTTGTKNLPDRIIIPGVAPYQPRIEIHCQDFSLQDGIDFAKFAIQLTVDTMRFQAVPKTVGGPIDILVITSDGTSWVACKKLHA